MGNMKLSWPLKSHVKTNLILISMTFSSKMEIQHGIIFQIKHFVYLVTTLAYHILVQGRCHEIFTNSTIILIDFLKWQISTRTKWHKWPKTHKMKIWTILVFTNLKYNWLNIWQELCPHLVFNYYSPNTCEHFSIHIIKLNKTKSFECFKLKQREINIRLVFSNVPKEENFMSIWL